MSIKHAVRSIAGLVFLGAVWFAAPAALPDDWQPIIERAEAVWGYLREFVRVSYERVPGLVLGLAALLVVPPLAILGLLLHRKGRRKRNTRTHPVLADQAPERGAQGPAYVEVIEPQSLESATRLPLPRTMLSIGRHEDNAIRLPDPTVHRYHAVIHWTPETSYMITDLSGDSGNGVLVNGTRISQAALAGGDVIELGQVKLRFGTAQR